MANLGQEQEREIKGMIKNKTKYIWWDVFVGLYAWRPFYIYTRTHKDGFAIKLNLMVERERIKEGLNCKRIEDSVVEDERVVNWGAGNALIVRKKISIWDQKREDVVNTAIK